MAQGYNDKLDESLGEKDGALATKDPSTTEEARRNESRGEKKSLAGGDIDALISHYEEGLSLLKAHKASMGGGDELVESVGEAEVLPDGDILAEGAAIAEPMPPMPPMPLGVEGLPMAEEEEAFDLDALTAAAAKNALA